MATIGTLSAVNLIAGAGILGNVGGVAIIANANLSNNIATYNSLSVVSQFANIAVSGYVTIDIVANSFPALTDAVPTAYQSNLGNATGLTTLINNQAGNVLGNGDLGIFEQVFTAAQAYVDQNNVLIKSAVNANSANATVTFVSSDTVITGGVSSLTQALAAFGADLARTGRLIDMADLNRLGSPQALLQQLVNVSYIPPGLNTALLDAGLTTDTIDNIPNQTLTLEQQRRAYQAMQLVTGNSLREVLRLLSVTTANIANMADLLNPVKIFPASYTTFTTPTANGLRAIYVNAQGEVNSALQTQLPAVMLAPLNGVPQPMAMTYQELSQVIPPDQALANKAITNALLQVKNILNTTAPEFAAAVSGLENNYGLDLINELTAPVTASSETFYTTNLVTGSGPDGTLLLVDVIGSPTGWVYNTSLTNAITAINSLTVTGALDELTNATTGVYTVMQNTIAGTYGAGPLTIPGGLPGAGTYATITLAFNSGLNPAMVTAVSNIVTNNTALVTVANQAWSNMAAQLSLENTNISASQIDFGNLLANVEPVGIVNNLSAYGLDVAQGGAAYVMESLANLQAIGGQAIVSTMRESRNLQRFDAIGINTDITVSSAIAEPRANLGQSQYSVAQATANKII